MPAPVLQVKRGASSNLPGLRAGEPAFTTDSYDFYVGIDSTTNNNKFVGSHRYWKKETASSGSGVNLVEATGGSDFITLAAPASVGTAVTYTFPAAPTDGYFLKTNSTGTLSWEQVVSDFYIAADSGSPDLVSTGSTITFVGGSNVNTEVTDNTITVNLDNNISVSGLSTFSGLIDGNGGLDITGHTELDNVNVSGVVTATTFIGNLTGIVTTATRATTVDTTEVATNQNYNLTFTDGSGTGKTVGVDSELLYNPNTNVLSVPNINSGAIRAADGTSAITITSTTGEVGFANSVTISGDLYVRGTTTEINTSTLKVEDTLVDLGLVNDNGTLVPPSSDLNLDIGILLNWYSGSAKKASVYWDDSAGRVGIASDVTESSGVLTANAYAAVEIGALWVTDCAGTSQVISCTGTERFLENITIDAGTF